MRSLSRIRLDIRCHQNSSSAVRYQKVFQKQIQGGHKVKFAYSSVMCLGLVPINEIVTDLDDLEYVNWKFSASDLRDATTDAGVRIMKGRANQEDRDQVRQYQRHHMWSPMTSELPSPLTLDSKCVFPGRDGGAANNESTPIKLGRVPHDETTRSRPLCSADFEDSDDEDDVSRTCMREDAGAVPPLEDILECPGAEMRKIQLLLQAKILREIAELVNEHGVDYGLWDDAVAGWPDEEDHGREVSR